MSDFPDMPSTTLATWSKEAEQAVLGGLMLEPAAFERVSDALAPEAFFDSRHGSVFAAIRSLASEGRPADPITVLEAMQGRHDNPGLAYLNAMAQSVPSAASVRHYAEIVAEKAAQRRLMAQAEAALVIAAGSGTAAEKLDKITAAFVALERGQQRSVPRQVSELIGAALDRYTELAEGRSQAGIETGIAALDRLLSGGLKPGKLYGIAARPSVGKSSAARTILLRAARDGLKTLLLSQEMPAEELTDALVAEAGRVDGSLLQSGQLSSEDWSRIVDAAELLKIVPLHVDDEGGLTLAQVRAKARSVKGLRVLAVDYLQLMSSTLKDKTTNDQVGEISRGLKALALEMHIPIIVLSQLSREVERRTDKEPVLSDLRDSGNIEQDLDVAVMLWTAQESPDSESRLVGWKVAKHRGGKRGVFAMRWRPAINEWRESFEPLHVQVAKRTKGYDE